MEMEERIKERMLMMGIKSGHTTWDVVFSKMSV